MSLAANDQHVRRYYGKYRGTVVDNADPQGRGRLVVTVPDVLARTPSTWALPCVPLAGAQNGFFALPVPGSAVWVEFEHGDPDYPIWVGCFWGSQSDLPSMAQAAPASVPAITLQTPLENGVTISDVPGPSGGLLLRSSGGASILINDTGIVIDNGAGAILTLRGPTVDINNGALTVT